MALSAATVLEVRTTGNDTNGGGFVTGATGTDWSQQDSPQYSVTDGVTAGTTTITSATAAFGTDVVGNLISVSGGTGSITQGWYQIISRTNATTIVVDRSTGLTSGTGVTLKIGGALLSPSIAGLIATVAGMTVYIKNGTYSITSASTGVAGGCIATTAGTLYIGYSSTRTISNTGTQPILQLNVASATLIGSGNTVISNIAFDGNSQTSAKLTSFAEFHRCSISGFNTASTGSPNFSYCKVTANSGNVMGGGTGAIAKFCEVFSNTATQTIGTIDGSLIYNNTGATTDGVNANNAAWNHIYGNGRDGIRKLNASPGIWANNHCENNAGWGFNNVNGPNLLVNNSHYNNTSGGVQATSGNPIVEIGTIAATSTVYVNAAGVNFALNTTSTGGRLLLAAGFPGAFPTGTTTAYHDIGAVQHADLRAGFSIP